MPEEGAGKKLVTVATHLFPDEAEIMRARLEEAGITVFLRDIQVSQNMLDATRMGVQGVKIDVPEEQAEEARAALADLEEFASRRVVPAYRIRFNRAASLGIAGLLTAVVFNFVSGDVDWVIRIGVSLGLLAAGILIGRQVKFLKCSECLTATLESEPQCSGCEQRFFGTVDSLRAARDEQLDA